MKLAVFNPVLYGLSLEDALKYLKSMGVRAMELGCGGSPGTKHADVKALYKSPEKVKSLKGLFEKYGIEICALSVHGNGVHPDKKVADLATEEFDKACAVASRLGVDRIVTFSGCPGDKTSSVPNWVTCSWPTEFGELLEWQWEEVLIPYWKKEAAVAADAGVKVAFEMHPGFCVHSPATLMRLRAAVGDAVGANFDPSHLIWQGIDLAESIKYLGAAIYHFHAKDTMFNPSVKAVTGVLDTKPYTKETDRAWLFRTVGYGACDFRGMLSALRMVGYDRAISIEHEDSLMTVREGLEKAIRTLQDIIIFDDAATEAWWI